jgi:hypothetical protein
MPLLAYDAAGNVVGSLDEIVQQRPDGSLLRLDMAAHEAAGGEATDYARFEHPDGIKGAKVWHERIRHPHEFRVELEGGPGAKRIAALIHRQTGERRLRGER